RRVEAYSQLSSLERELRRVLTPEQWREHEAFIKRRDDFNALFMSEKEDIARWILAVDADLADKVKNGFVPLFEARNGCFMPPLGFTDDEMDSLTALASALPPSSRHGFLQLVANKLSGYPSGARGPGLVHRIAAEAQRDFLKGGPIAVGAGGKYGRPYSV